MTTLVTVLAGTVLLARAIGAWSGNALDSWTAATRAGLAIFFLFTGVCHFVPEVRDTMIRMVPPAVPHPAFAVAFTGLCEIAGALGLLIPRTRRLAAGALIIFLIAVFPANARAAREALLIAGRPATPVVPRAAMQAVLMALLFWSSARAGE